jgi:hypothetical protein
MLSERAKELWTAEDYEFEAFRLACLLYSSHGAETEDIRSAQRRNRVQQLHKCLTNSEISTYWTGIPGALIWCLAVGTKESWESEEYSWFQACLTPMLLMLAMERWKQLERSLNIFAWLFKCARTGTVLARQ